MLFLIVFRLNLILVILPDNVFVNHDNIVTIEEGCLSGGFGSAVSAFLHDNNLENKLHRIGIPDNFVEHGARDELLVELGLCVENIISILSNDKLEEVYE